MKVIVIKRKAPTSFTPLKLNIIDKTVEIICKIFHSSVKLNFFLCALVFVFDFAGEKWNSSKISHETKNTATNFRNILNEPSSTS